MNKEKETSREKRKSNLSRRLLAAFLCICMVVGCLSSYVAADAAAAKKDGQSETYNSN